MFQSTESNWRRRSGEVRVSCAARLVVVGLGGWLGGWVVVTEEISILFDPCLNKEEGGERRGRKKGEDLQMALIVVAVETW